MGGIKVIEAKGVCLAYPDGTLALKNINLQIKTGEMVYITGPSGTGKTSLLKLFMGMEYPTEGSMQVLKQSIIKGQEANIQLLRQAIGPVFQEFRLIAGRTALDNVMLSMRFLDISPKQLKERAKSALKEVGLAHKELSLAENLSWGERQRLAIARAVVRKPRLILADEPTGNLDKDNAVNILDLLASFKNEKTTVIITTHATHLIDDKKDGVFIEVHNQGIRLERREGHLYEDVLL